MVGFIGTRAGSPCSGGTRYGGPGFNKQARLTLLLN